MDQGKEKDATSEVNQEVDNGVAGQQESTGEKRQNDAVEDSKVATAILRNMEEDAVAKSRKKPPGTSATLPGAVAEGAAETIAMAQLEKDAMEKAKMRGQQPCTKQVETTAGTTGPSAGKAAASAGDGEKGRNGKGFLAYSSVRDIETEDDLPESAPQSDAELSTGVSSSTARGATETNAVGPTSGSESYQTAGHNEGEALDAFVAEQEPVVATDVAVLMSEEEQQEMERRQKRYLIAGCIALILVAVAVVVPVTLVTGRNDSGVIENEPSAAPSPAPSAAPSTALLAETIDFLIGNNVSQATPFNNKDSPQYQAAEWIANEDGFGFANDSEQTRWLQRYRLATFYFATNGDFWTSCGRQSESCEGGDQSKWLEAEDECVWHAIICRNGVVVEISFNPYYGSSNQKGNSLEGELPEELFQVTDLETFIVLSNKLSGTMSESFGKLTKLQRVVLRENLFTGTIPEGFWQNNRNLTLVYLGNNSFDGHISTFLSGLPLYDLQLEQNNITGSIPASLFDVSTLQKLYLHSNELTGTLSERLGELTALTDLQLQNNIFTGPLPSSIDNLSQLAVLKLESNQLTGTISDTVCSVFDVNPSVDCEEVTCPVDCCQC